MQVRSKWLPVGPSCQWDSDVETEEGSVIIMSTRELHISVFLDSRKHGRLPCTHPFHIFIIKNLLHVVKSPLVLQYMARSTFPDKSLGTYGDIAEERRVLQIREYLMKNHPTVSGSDSPAMGSSVSQYAQVDTRAYSGCGNSRRSRKVARKHIYIKKSLVDAWMDAYGDHYL